MHIHSRKRYDLDDTSPVRALQRMILHGVCYKHAWYVRNVHVSTIRPAMSLLPALHNTSTITRGSQWGRRRYPRPTPAQGTSTSSASDSQQTSITTQEHKTSGPTHLRLGFVHRNGFLVRGTRRSGEVLLQRPRFPRQHSTEQYERLNDPARLDRIEIRTSQLASCPATPAPSSNDSPAWILASVRALQVCRQVPLRLLR